MRVAGIDPSLNNFGMVKGTLIFEGPTLKDFLLENVHLCTSSSDKANKKTVRKNSDDLQRARMLHQGLTEFIEDVDLVMVEIPVGSQSARAMASYGICIGILASVATPMIQVTPTEVKLAAVGSKTATKAEMIQWAVEHFPDGPWLRHKQHGEMKLTNLNEHLADATAAIVAGTLTDNFKQMTAFLKATG